MQSSILKFRQSSVICKLKIEKVENFHVFQLPYSLTFFMSKKECLGFFYFA